MTRKAFKATHYIDINKETRLEIMIVCEDTIYFVCSVIVDRNTGEMIEKCQVTKSMVHETIRDKYFIRHSIRYYLADFIKK